MSFVDVEPREALVRVVDLQVQRGYLGSFKTATLLEEIGEWHNKLCCNVFSSFPIYEKLEKGMLLKIKVRFFKEY